ncbi:hypothetical protein IQ238_27785 [Pleurocapsales cyanobacterium LEGE 06147]|nr:hypothetical protein [Pleurocapsales cyanobacterium LEGE 06147]
MNIKVVSDSEVLQEGLEVLMNHLEPNKVLRFWAACQLGKGDYLKLKQQLFSQETVASLYEKVRTHQEELTDKK